MAERRTPGAQPFHHNPVMPLQRAGAQPWGASGGGGGLFANAAVHYNQTSISGSSPTLVWGNLGTAGSGLDLTLFSGSGAAITEGTENGLSCVVSDGTTDYHSASTHDFPTPSTYFSVTKWVGGLAGHKYMQSGSSWMKHLRYYNSSEQASIINGATNLVNGGIVGGQLDIACGVLENDNTSYHLRYGIGAVTGSTGTENGAGWTTLFAALGGGTPYDGKICHISGFDGRLSQDDIDAIIAELVSIWVP